jgi:hypothetical protein
MSTVFHHSISSFGIDSVHPLKPVFLSNEVYVFIKHCQQLFSFNLHRFLKRFIPVLIRFLRANNNRIRNELKANYVRPHGLLPKGIRSFSILYFCKNFVPISVHLKLHFKKLTGEFSSNVLWFV